MKNTFAAIAAVVVVIQTVMADTHTWVGGSSAGGGWNTASNWKNESGAAECPSAGDIALFDSYGDTVVANDSDAALFCSLGGVRLDAWSTSTKSGQTVVLDVSTDITAGCSINGIGRFVKRGTGTVTLDSTDGENFLTVGGVKYYNTYNVVDGGLCVENGTLVLPQGKSICYAIQDFSVGTDAAVTLPDNKNFLVYRLAGGGTVRQLSSSDRTFQIGRERVSSEWTEFSGKLTGNIRILCYGNQGFSGATSDFSGYLKGYCGSGYDKQYGTVGLSTFGSSSSAYSSMGKPSDNTVYLMYCSNLRYLGSGETTDRIIQVDTQPVNKKMSPNTFDAGTYGGLRLKGALNWGAWGGASGGNVCWNQNAFVFDGSNTVACTLAGPIQLAYAHGTTNFYHYLIKKGSGTWRFEENASTTHRGVVDVREGTLQFNTLASAGKLCALGYGDNPIEEYYGAYDPAKTSPYALRIGSSDSTNAVLDYVGYSAGVSTNRKMLVCGDARLRVSDGAFDFAGVSATDDVTLTLDGDGPGEKILRDVSGSLSLVKEGTGTWYLLDDQTFTGDLTVRSGTVRVGYAPQTNRYFRVSFQGNYGNSNNGYIMEFALYDKDGNRLNNGVTFAKPEDVAWDATYKPCRIARTLAAGTMGFDSLSDTVGCDAFTYTASSDGNRPLNLLTDGTDKYSQFATRLSSSYPGVVSMRLADDAAEVAYLDFAQAQIGTAPTYQTASHILLESSPDGIVWTKVAEKSDLPISSWGKWYFSTSGKYVNNNSGKRTLGNGEGFALTTRAVSSGKDNGGDKLTKVGYVSVAGGAALEADPDLSVTVSKIRIDADAGSGAFGNVRFASEMTVDVTGLKPRQSRTVSVDFTGVVNFDAVEKWIFLQNGQPAKLDMAITKTALIVRPKGLTLIFR